MYEIVWSPILGILYTTMSLLLFWFGPDMEHYQSLYKETLDWKNAPEMSIIVIIAVGCFVMPLCHLFQLGITVWRDRLLREKKYSEITIDLKDQV